MRAERFPHSLILAGPKGAGKYTLALMLARAFNCLNPTESDGLPDFCGVARIARALPRQRSGSARGRSGGSPRGPARHRQARDAHPDPDASRCADCAPDPPQLQIKIGQVRQVIHVAYYRPPVESKRTFTIFTSSAFMREAANSLLKVLEEPPEHTSLILLTENPQELLPTIRSRAVVHRLGALPAAELEALLAKRRPLLKAADRALAARLAEGAVGRALTIDLDCLPGQPAGCAGDPANGFARARLLALFHATESYRAGADGQEKSIQLLRALGSLIEDLLLVVAGTPRLVRNLDLAAELERLAQGLTVDWIDGAARAMTQVEQGMRRNLLRSLSLDAMAAPSPTSREEETLFAIFSR
jgi:DNA polymerase-3 subunit delta'